MARPGSNLNIPTIEIIININSSLIEKYGGEYLGWDNLLNRNSLEWVLDAIQHPFFNIDPYPTMAHKAAIIAWTINADHVFYDGNKRTAMYTAMLFLWGNGFELITTHQDILDISLKVANNRNINFTFKEYVEWFNQRIQLQKE